MGTVGTFALLVFAAFVGIGVGELLGDVLLGSNPACADRGLYLCDLPLG